MGLEGKILHQGGNESILSHFLQDSLLSFFLYGALIPFLQFTHTALQFESQSPVESRKSLIMKLLKFRNPIYDF